MVLANEPLEPGMLHFESWPLVQVSPLSNGEAFTDATTPCMKYCL